MLRLILIDDYGLIRHGLEVLISAAGDIEVIAAASHHAVKEQLSTCQVLVLSLRHLDASCFEQLQEITLIAPQLAIIVMAGSNEASVVASALSKGVLGYLGKDATATELLTAIQKVAVGMRYLPPLLARELMLNQMVTPNKGMHDNPFLNLGVRENYCARLLAQGKKTLEISQLMAISKQTVNSYRHRIFQKLQVSGEVELIKLALRYALIEEPSDVS